MTRALEKKRGRTQRSAPTVKKISANAGDTKAVPTGTWYRSVHVYNKDGFTADISGQLITTTA